MLNLGLTGGIGSGKSTVARMFATLGAPVLDSDALVRSMLELGQDGTAATVAAFGGSILKEDGSVDRKALGALVFEDMEARKKLEAILHPMVRAARREWLVTQCADCGPGVVTVSEAALIFEAGTWQDFDGVVLVVAPIEVRKARLLAKGWDGPEIDRRIAAQWDDERKAAQADWVIDNGGTEERTQEQVNTHWKRFTTMAVARNEANP